MTSPLERHSPVTPSGAPWRSLLLLGVGYFWCALIGELVSPPGLLFVCFWLPNGLLTGMLLRAETRQWPAYAAVAFASHVGFEFTSGRVFGWGLATAAGNVLAVLVGVALMRRWCSARPRLGTLKEVVGLVVTGSGVGAALSATAGTLFTRPLPALDSLGGAWLLHWSGDALGVLLIAPLVLTWRPWAGTWFRPEERSRRLEALAILLLVGVCNGYVFRDALHPSVPLSFLVVPLLLWVALRFDLRATAAFNLSVALAAAWFTAQGQSYLGTSGLPPWKQFVALQLATGVMAVTGLFLVAAWQERRTAEATLRESEDRLRTAARAAGFGTYSYDFATQTESWSPELRQLFGVAPEQPLRTDADKVFVGVHPDDRAQFLRAIEAADAPGSDGLLRVEYRVIHADGTVRWVQSRGRTFFAGEGAARHPVRAAGIVFDITERRQAEASLQESEQRHRLVLEQSGDAILLGLPDGRILSANPAACRMFGYSEAEILAAQRFGLAEPTDARWAAAVAERDARGSFRGVLSFVRRGGARFEGEVTATVYADSSGQRRTSVVIRDITERHRAEEEVRRALAEKEVLLQEVHHRVKNNLQVVSGLLALQAERVPDPLVRAAFSESQSRIQSMALVHEKLYQTSSLARLDFQGYVHGVVSHLVLAYQRRGGAMRCDFRMAECTLDLSTAVPCGLLINELVTNVLKHAASADQILLAWEDLGARWRLTVADNGPGLPAGLDWAHPQTLGLRLVRLLAQQLKGTVEVGPGPGCRFVVEFPKK